MALCLVCAALIKPVPDQIFLFEMGNCFTQESLTLDSSYHYVLRGHDCCGDYQGEGYLQPAEAENFLAEVDRRFQFHVANEVWGSGETFQTTKTFWQGEWNKEDQAWFATTRCAREEFRIRKLDWNKREEL